MKNICAIAVLLSCINVALCVNTLCKKETIDSELTCTLSNAYYPIGISFSNGLQAEDKPAVRVIIPYASETTLPFIFQEFAALKKLEIPTGDLATLKAEALKKSGSDTAPLTTVLSIMIKNSKISKMETTAFQKCTALTHLDLSHNLIATFDPNFDAGLVELVSLNLAFNKIVTLFTSATVFTKVQFFNVSGNLLTTASITLPTASSPLKQIDFSRNRISTIAKDQFNAYTNLEEIRLGENLLTTLDADTFNTFANLKVLDVSVNAFTSLDFLIKATKVQILNISNTAIVKFADTTLEKMTELRYLFASNNKIKHLATSAFIKNTKLEMLDVSGNRIDEVDSDFFDLMTTFKAVNFTCNKCLSSILAKKPTAKDIETCGASSVIISTALTLISIALIKFF